MRIIGPDVDRSSIVAGSKPAPMVLPRISIMADGQTIHSWEVAPLVRVDSRDQGRVDRDILTFTGVVRH